MGSDESPRKKKNPVPDPSQFISTFFTVERRHEQKKSCLGRHELIMLRNLSPTERVLKSFIYVFELHHMYQSTL